MLARALRRPAAVRLAEDHLMLSTVEAHKRLGALNNILRFSIIFHSAWTATLAVALVICPAIACKDPSATTALALCVFYDGSNFLLLITSDI